LGGDSAIFVRQMQAEVGWQCEMRPIRPGVSSAFAEDGWKNQRRTGSILAQEKRQPLSVAVGGNSIAP
jgi:hypothetical protein